MKINVTEIGPVALESLLSWLLAIKVSRPETIEIEEEAVHTAPRHNPIGSDDLGQGMVPGPGHGVLLTEKGYRIKLNDGKSTIIPSKMVCPVLRMKLARKNVNLLLKMKGEDDKSFQDLESVREFLGKKGNSVRAEMYNWWHDGKYRDALCVDGPGGYPVGTLWILES